MTVRWSGRMLIGVLIAMLALPVLAGCAAETQAPVDETPASTEPAAPGAGGGDEIPDTDTERDLVESSCSQCHGLDQVWEAQKDAAGWDSTVRRMEANGLQLTDEERQRIVDYLASQ